MRPAVTEGWFNILMLHQNRIAHSEKNYIHEEMIDNFLDLVIWGHEHESLVPPSQSSVGDFHISQPGSSIATSLSESESKKKYIGLLEVQGTQFRMSPILLKTVRPFVMGDVALSAEELDPTDTAQITDFLAKRVEDLLQQASEDWPKLNPAMPTLPLVRLRVDLAGDFPAISSQRFGQRFVGKVANPTDILLFQKKRKVNENKKISDVGNIDPNVTKTLKTDDQNTATVEVLIQNFLANGNLNILPENEFNIALHNFVEKDDKSAILDFVAKTLTSVQNTLKDQDPSKTQCSSDIERQVMEITDIKRASSQSQSDDLPLPKSKSTSGADEENDENEEKQQKSDNDEDKVHNSDEDEKPKIKDKPKKTTKKSKEKTKSEPKSGEPKGRGRGRGKKQQKQGYVSLDVTGGKSILSSDDEVVILPNKDVKIKDDVDEKKRKRDVLTMLKDPPVKKDKNIIR